MIFDRRSIVTCSSGWGGGRKGKITNLGGPRRRQRRARAARRGTVLKFNLLFMKKEKGERKRKKSLGARKALRLRFAVSQEKKTLGFCLFWHKAIAV
jgi:hypothetical protein